MTMAGHRDPALQWFRDVRVGSETHHTMWDARQVRDYDNGGAPNQRHECH